VDCIAKRPDRAITACDDGVPVPIREVAMRAEALAREITVDRIDLEALDSS
jgi:hypothetical protein